MSNRIFVDSSVFVEAMKGKQLLFFKAITNDVKNICYVNDIVLSEYLFYLISINGTAAPKSMHKEGKVPAVVANHLMAAKALSAYTYLSNTPALLSSVPDIMIKYNLLPNDAIIIATCLNHNISKLATLDMDFKPVCDAERIEFLHPDFI